MDAEKMRGKKFIASYSGGKDSLLATYRAMQSGLIPLELVTAYNIDAGRSWFHGLNENLLQRVSASLAIPVALMKTSPEKYEENFEKMLVRAKENGAEACVFGDIDIEGHLEWGASRCENAGLVPYFPLWKENRKKIVREFIDAGFLSVITIVDIRRMTRDFLGQVLDRDVAGAIEAGGADICGENGEYHTFAFDGPIFSRSVSYEIKGIVEQGHYAILHIE